jgi:hypothetical protein
MSAKNTASKMGKFVKNSAKITKKVHVTDYDPIFADKTEAMSRSRWPRELNEMV